MYQKHVLVPASNGTSSRDMSLWRPAVEHVLETYPCVSQQWNMYQRHVLVSFACGTCTRDMSLHSQQWNMYLVHVPLLAIQDNFSGTCSTAGRTRTCLWYMFHCWSYKDCAGRDWFAWNGNIKSHT